jgi:hypothetical protein
MIKNDSNSIKKTLKRNVTKRRLESINLLFFIIFFEIIMKVEIITINFDIFKK